MESRVRGYLVTVIAFSLLALTAPRSAAKCDPTGADAADVAAARAAVAANCDCAGAANHGTFVSCAAGQAKATLMNQSCKGFVVSGAAHSTCGPTGSGILGATIVRTNTVTLDGAANGMIVSSQALCEPTERLLSGGVSVDTAEPNELSKLSVVQSAPLAPAAANGWLVEVLATSFIFHPLFVTASALCLVQ
jgi:hypothetical protein